MKRLLALTILAAPACAFMPTPVFKAPIFRRATALCMAMEVGEKLPMTTTFQELKDGKPTDVSPLEIFAGKKVVVVGVPGALTPTCSEKHVPGFLAKADEFFAKGVDSIVVLSVNDAFVMNSWAQKLDAPQDSKIKFLADGGAAFTNEAGLGFDTGNFGGVRLQRMSALVEDGVVKRLHLEGGGGFTTSSAEVLLEELA